MSSRGPCFIPILCLALAFSLSPHLSFPLRYSWRTGRNNSVRAGRISSPAWPSQPRSR
ncbi:hypothetical protein L227DRAFT_577730 [Lentinus tigrinus ALCF2SS1-6]|uniref:Uncharacterized protein n=1 Tax=Lentinus tigrinus ALCF2SS1-6 TaxID=1328759 RepID=A0A5C2S2T4_9APHY|nr:hypothetical protein L227DRAFT_577730 [Lentinus tigrinus ALCF2SS1-6]